MSGHQQHPSVKPKERRWKKSQHAALRAMQRCGMSLTMADLKAIGKAVRTEQTTCIRKKTHRISEHEYEYKGERLRFYYDRNLHIPVTFLPFDPDRPPGRKPQRPTPMPVKENNEGS